MTRSVPPDGGYAVREARGADLEPIRELGLVALPRAYHGVIQPELIRLLLAKWWTTDALVPIIRAGRAFVAEDTAGRLLGMCSYGPHGGSYALRKLFVADHARGRGVGAALLAAAQERARDAGLPLRVSYTAGNREAPVFCARQGYVEVGREPQAGMPDVVWMAQAGGDTAGDDPQAGGDTAGDGSRAVRS